MSEEEVLSNGYHIIYLLLLLCFPKSLSAQNDKYNICSKKLECGGSRLALHYPFYDGSTRPDYCGYPGFKLNCSQGIPQIAMSDREYSVSAIDFHSYDIRVHRKDNWTSICPDSLNNTAMDLSRFNFTSSDQNITFFYDCAASNDLSSLSLQTSCDLEGHGSQGGYYLTRAMLEQYKDLNLLSICKVNLLIPILKSNADDLDSEPNLETLRKALVEGFELGLMAENEACSTCFKSGGECGYDWGSRKFVCYCVDADYDIQCRVHSSYQDGKSKTPLLIGVSIGAVALLALLGGCLLYILQKCKTIPQNQIVEDSLKNYASLVPKRYTYKYIKKISNSFREKLGEGGYGTVFKGNFKDGRVVAVKVWKQSKGDGQDFINEVMSISRTSHVNVVPLLGFCFEGHKRALIYEFMPNGSLEKFIQGRYFNENNQPLSAQKLFEIGVGIARGLEYLHRGCNTRIVHFDIKPHNILLDAEFTPKISDFGLAKSMKQKESIISMSGARGTAGYIAPEVFFRTYGGVSHKSDVYSFGMMVLEMVGCKNRVNDNSENSSEMYFPQWIYKQLEQETSIVDCERILNEEEKKLERKMIVVGLWCIQTNPSSRPSMSRVVEMLEGRVELLEVPPMPILCSPPRQQQPTDDDDSATFLSSSTTYAYAASINS